MTSQSLVRRLVSIDTTLVNTARRGSITWLRLSIGLVYIWFGALKLFPGYSPAEPLIRAAYEQFTFLPMREFIAFIGVWEILIGALFLIGRWPRLTIALMLLQMGGAVSPLVLAPHAVWVNFPHVWTLEGQYIFKDIILIAAALVVGAATMHRLPSGDNKRKTFVTREIPIENLRR